MAITGYGSMHDRRQGGNNVLVFRALMVIWAAVTDLNIANQYIETT